jgi:hypothetical protein
MRSALDCYHLLRRKAYNVGELERYRLEQEDYIQTLCHFNGKLLRLSTPLVKVEHKMYGRNIFMLKYIIYYENRIPQKSYTNKVKISPKQPEV